MTDLPEGYQWMPKAKQQWIEDCLRWRGKVLTGKFAHWCDDWDGLPIDETSLEWPCACADDLQRKED